jgi:hypothetical protein
MVTSRYVVPSRPPRSIGPGPAAVVAGLILCVAVPAEASAARCEPLPLPEGNVRVVRSAGQLENAVRDARRDSAIVLEDGVYEISRMLDIRASGVTLRGRSADPSKTIIRGGGMSDDSVGVALSVSASGVTIAHLSVGRVRHHGIQVRGETGASGLRVYAVRVFDTGQQLLKGSFAPNGRTADNGVVECSTFEYSDHAPSDYTNGIDLIGTKDWVIRDNRFARIRGPRDGRWSAGPAILVWGGAEGTVVERNLVVDCFRGIALGLGPGVFDTPRGGDSDVDHRGGLVRQNVVINLNEWADEGIEANAAPGVTIEFNTVLVEGRVPWSIGLRFSATSGVARNNLTARRITFRDRGSATLEGNVDTAARSWFLDAMSGNVRLAGTAVRAIDAGVPVTDPQEDFDGLPRAVGERPDAGAFEYQGRGQR